MTVSTRSPVKKAETIRGTQLKSLKALFRKGEGDIAAGRATTIESDEDIEAFFANL